MLSDQYLTEITPILAKQGKSGKAGQDSHSRVRPALLFLLSAQSPAPGRRCFPSQPRLWDFQSPDSGFPPQAPHKKASFNWKKSMDEYSSSSEGVPARSTTTQVRAEPRRTERECAHGTASTQSWDTARESLLHLPIQSAPG